jgi:alpha-glucosidase
MQWDRNPQAGFCPPGVEPWLPVAAGYETMNVQSQSEDPHSMLAFTRHLIALRQASPALLYGRYRSLQADGSLLIYERQAEDERMFILLNFSPEPREWTLPEGIAGQVVLSTLMEDGVQVTGGKITVRGHEGLVLR